MQGFLPALTFHLITGGFGLSYQAPVISWVVHVTILQDNTRPVVDMFRCMVHTTALQGNCKINGGLVLNWRYCGEG